MLAFYLVRIIILVCVLKPGALFLVLAKPKLLCHENLGGIEMILPEYSPDLQ